MTAFLITVLRIVIPTVYFLVSAIFVYSFVKKQKPLHLATASLAWIGLFCHSALILMILFSQGRFPLATTAEGLTFCGWVIALSVITLMHSHKESGFGAFLFPAGFLVSTLGIALLNQMVTLPRELGAHTFLAHTWILFAAYACFIISAITSIMYIVQHHEIRNRSLGSFYERLPALGVMDQLVKRADALGLSLLIMGIVLGFYGIHSFSSEKPPNVNIKIAFSLVAAAIYACEHILRMGKGWDGKRACLISLAGFVVVIATFLAGRHGF